MACSFDPVTPERRQKRQWANIQGEHSPKLQEMKVISQHGFRAARRAAARDRQQRSIEKLEARVKELQNTRVQYITVEKEVVKVHEKVVEVLVEKIVEVPVNNETIVEKSIQVPDKMSRFTEEDITAAFIKGTETAKHHTDKLTSEVLQAARDTKNEYEKKANEYEKKLEEANTKGIQMKEMLGRVLKESKDLRDEVAEVAKLKMENANLKMISDLYKKSKAEVTQLSIENASLKKVAEAHVQQRPVSDLCHQISAITGAEVTMQAVDVLVHKFKQAGEELNEGNIAAIYDCGVFDILKKAYEEYVEALTKAMAGGEEQSSHDEAESDDSASDDSRETCVDESFLVWERENG